MSRNPSAAKPVGAPGAVVLQAAKLDVWLPGSQVPPASGGLVAPSLAACQVIATLKYAFHLTDNSNLHHQMCSMSLNMARAINLHLLGSGHSGSREEMTMREMGRRAWGIVVEIDWYLLPYNRFSSINPQQFDTALPSLTDEGGLASSTAGPHCLTFLLACCHSSRLLYDVYATLGSSQNPSYETVLSALARLEQMVQNLPPEVREAAEMDKASPDHPYLWCFLVMMLAYRSYLIHRAYFVAALSDWKYQASRAACIQAASTIMELAEKGLPATFYRLWNTTLWLVAAGLVHAASQGLTDPGISTQRRRLSKLVGLLGTVADRSGIGARGAGLIKHLCIAEEEIRSGGSISRMQLTREDIVNLVRGSSSGTGQARQDDTGSRPRGHLGPTTSSRESSLSNRSMLDAGTAEPDVEHLPPPWRDIESFEGFGLAAERRELYSLFSDMFPDSQA